jgi:T-complex protein 1 subunit eta
VAAVPHARHTAQSPTPPLTFAFPLSPSLSPPLSPPPPPRREGKWWGVDIEKEGICDTFAEGVWEPVSSKINSFASATEAACLVLSVDETVRNPKSQQEGGGPQGRPGGGGMAGGKKISSALGGKGMQSLIGKGRGVRMYQGKGGR